jgi:hypothetical protein
MNRCTLWPHEENHLCHNDLAVIPEAECVRDRFRDRNLKNEVDDGRKIKKETAQSRTCSCGFEQPSSFGTTNKNPESSAALPVTRNISPSTTPGHHDWLNMTDSDCDSLSSCTHELKTFESPGLSGASAGLLMMEDEVFDRRRPYWVCWDSDRVTVIEDRGRMR